jgi:acetyl-CoA synthetase
MRPVASRKEYERLHRDSLSNPELFWGNVARQYIHFNVPFDKVKQGDLPNGDTAWFLGGKLNACYNAVDRHLPHRAQQTAILWEADQPGICKHITYQQLLQEVCKLAAAMKKIGVKKGDVVCIYMPMIPEAVFAMLACARIGAIHS